MAKKKKVVRASGLRPINSKMNRPIYRSDENTGDRYTQLKPFSLEEHLDDRPSAAVAQIEWMCEGYYCHIEVDAVNMVYYVWVGPKRKRPVKLLPKEIVKRHKGMTIHFSKRRALKAM